MDIGFDVNEVANLLDLSESTIHDYKRSIEEGQYDHSENMETIESLQSQITYDIDKKEAARLQIKVADDLADEFETLQDFTDALEFQLDKKDSTLEDFDYDELSDMMQNHVSRRRRHLKSRQKYRYGGILTVIIGGLIISEGLFNLTSGFFLIAVPRLLIGSLLILFGLKLSGYQAHERMANLIHTQIREYLRLFLLLFEGLLEQNLIYSGYYFPSSTACLRLSVISCIFIHVVDLAIPVEPRHILTFGVEHLLVLQSGDNL